MNTVRTRERTAEYVAVYEAMTGPYATDAQCAEAARSVDWMVAHDYLVSKLHREPTEAEVNRVLWSM